MNAYCIIPILLAFLVASTLDAVGVWVKPIHTWGRRAFIVGVLLQTVYLIMWYYEIGAPFVVSESASVYLMSWVISLLYLFLGRSERWQSLGSLFSALALIGMAIGLYEQGGQYMTLQWWPHVWVVPVHLAASTVAVAVFAVAMGISILLHVQNLQLKRRQFLYLRLPSLRNLNGLLSVLISAGWILLSIVLATGIMMLSFQGGTIFGHWIWAMIAWLIYAVVLHFHFFTRGKSGLLLSVLGFLAILLTFFEAHSI